MMASIFSLKQRKFPKPQIQLACRNSNSNFANVRAKISWILSCLHRYSVISLTNKMLRKGHLYKVQNSDQSKFVWISISSVFFIFVLAQMIRVAQRFSWSICQLDFDCLNGNCCWMGGCHSMFWLSSWYHSSSTKITLSGKSVTSTLPGTSSIRHVSHHNTCDNTWPFLAPPLTAVKNAQKPLKNTAFYHQRQLPFITNPPLLYLSLSCEFSWHFLAKWTCPLPCQVVFFLKLISLIYN